MLLQGANHPPQPSLAFRVYSEQEGARKQAKSLYQGL